MGAEYGPCLFPTLHADGVNMPGGIRITCHCCHESVTYKDFSTMNVQIAMGLYVESDEGPICSDCYAMIQATSAYVDTTAKIREMRLEAMRESIKQVQRDNNFSPPEVRSLH